MDEQRRAVVDARSVQVMYDYANRLATPIPDDIRAVLEREIEPAPPSAV